MTSQLAENTLLTLLRNYYLFPACHTSRRCRTAGVIPHHRTFGTSTTKYRRAQGQGVHGEAVQNLVAKDGENGHVSFRASEAPSKVAGLRTNVPTSLKPQKNIAVIGGGITGLSTAYHLSQQLPDAQITLYERSSRLGGWMRTEKVNIGDGTVTFEQGPRTIRPTPYPQAMTTLELVKKLKLDIVAEPRDSDASRNRFIYYPDHLVRMPGPGVDPFIQIWEVLTEPVYTGLIPGILGEYWRPARASDIEDESVGSFLERRFGNSDIVENIASAILHGIYAGDIYQLSAKSLFPLLWEAERRSGSLIKWTLERFSNEKERASSLVQRRDFNLLMEMKKDQDLLEFTRQLAPMSLWSFPAGISTLSDALADALKANPNVRVKTNEELRTVEFDKSVNKPIVTTKTHQSPVQYDNIISTISGNSLNHLTQNSVPTLSKTHSVNVMVVNLCYANTSLLPVTGFGYLIPRSTPLEQNPERALGVIFDSALAKENVVLPGWQGRTTTKLTVMLGGHWWDSFSEYPDEAEGVAMAKSVLKRHLKIEEEPIAVHVGLQRQCIPQYTVGHDARMKKAHGELMQSFNGTLAVAGNSFTGVGVNDCVRAARDIAMEVSQYEGVTGITGLEQFQKPREWVWAST